MRLSVSERRRLLTFIVVVLLSGLIGAAYVLAMYSDGGPQTANPWRGFRAGLTISTLALGFELFLMRGGFGRWIARLRLWVGLLIRELILTSLIVLGLVANVILSRFQDGEEPLLFYPWRQLGIDFAFAFIVTGSILFVLQMRQLIGRRTFANILLGRYIRPVREERIFAIFDLVDSTRLAARMGDERFHALLSAVFADADRIVEDHGGEVHAYVGDALIATWPLGDERANALAAEAVFAVRDSLEARAPEFERRFGTRPKLRAAIHGGSVVAGECGDSKRQITYLGDTLNVTARMEGLAKAMGAGVLMSADLLSRSTLPPELEASDGAWHELKGLSRPIQVFRLTRKRDRVVTAEPRRRGALGYAGHSPGVG